MTDINEQTIVKLTDISVYYGFSKAISSVSFELKKGKALGLIGANGAGKTTTIKVLLGMIKPKNGRVSILGENKCSPSVLKKLGFAPEEASPPEYLTAKEYLGFLSNFKTDKNVDRHRQVDEFISWFELDPSKVVRKYSKGMKKRLILAQAFLGQPDLIVLDEPLNGLDPIMIHKLREKLKSYQEKGTSILYSSHILSELENTCTDVVMMHRGSVILKESISKLVEQFGSVEKAFSTKVSGV